MHVSVGCIPQPWATVHLGLVDGGGAPVVMEPLWVMTLFVVVSIAVNGMCGRLTDVGRRRRLPDEPSQVGRDGGDGGRGVR